MRNLKRALCLALASVMVLGMTVIGASAATASDFTDYDTVEEKEALDVMTEIGVIEGDGTGNFNPDGHFTREEAAKILSVLLLGADNAEKLNNNAQIFKDVAAGRWSAGFIAYCSNVGIIAGDGQGNFNPEGELDSVSFGKMLLVALGYDPAKEGYINNLGWQQSISGDMIAAGIDVADVKFDDILTREQATVMAFKAIQTPLVEYANYLDPSKATYLTTTIAEEQTISGRVLSNTTGTDSNGDPTPGTYTIEFAEKYHQDLIRSNDYTEEFRRPAHKWTYGSTNIGRYTDTPDAVYTTKVTTGQIYNDLELSESTKVAGNIKNVEMIGSEDYIDDQGNTKERPVTVTGNKDVSGYYIDGRPTYYLNRDPKQDEELWLSIDPVLSTNDSDNTPTGFPDPEGGYDYFYLRNKGNIELGGNGTLTEVYYHPVSYDAVTGAKYPATAEIVSVNTYVGDVTAKVGETDKHVAYITVTPRDETNDEYKGQTYDDPKPRTQIEIDGGYYYNSTYETEDFALEDLVIFTYSKRRDTSKDDDCGIQSVKTPEVVTGELTGFTAKDRAAVDGESYSYSNKVAKEAHDVDLNYEVEVTVDDYGYAIDVEPVDHNTGYAVILGFSPKAGDFGDIDKAKLALSNGRVINEAILKDLTSSEDYNPGDIVSYEVDNRGEYKIKLQARVNNADNLDSVESNFERETPAVILQVKNGDDVITQIVNRGSESGNPIIADGNTIFLIRDKDGNNREFFTPYYGIKNVPSVDTSTHNVPQAATVLLDKNNSSRAVLVYIDAADPDTIIDTSKEDYVYVLYNPNAQKQHDTDRGDYYTYDAIVNGELATIDVNEKTHTYLAPANREPNSDGLDTNYESTLFTVVQVDDYDVYSLEGVAQQANGVKRDSNDVLSFLTNDGYRSYVALDTCEVFYIHADDAISENTVSSVTDNDNIAVQYFTDDYNKLVCVVIDELPGVNVATQP